MNGGMQGLDPADCRDLVKVLKNSAHQLNQAGTLLSHAVARTGWDGPDSQRFRAQWPANRKRLSTTARDLEDAATQLLREIAEQERASSVDSGGFWENIVEAGQDLWDDVTEGVGNVVDGIGDAIDGAVDTVRDGLGWLADQIDVEAIIKASTSGAGHLSHFGSAFGDWLNGNPPSVSGLVASTALVLGSSFSTGVSVLSGGHLNLNLFEDGQPEVGEPIPVGPGNPRNELVLPSSAANIFQSTIDAYEAATVDGTTDGDVRIVRVEQPDGSFAFIVNIPGTEQWGPNGSGQGRDLTSNLMLVAGQSTSAQRAVVLAMEQAGIPPGAPVMLTGHSQGGMLAAALASDPAFMADYNVTNIMTVGSPIDGTGIDPRVNVLEVRHGGDLVPKLDLGGLNVYGQFPGQPSNVSTVVMDDPATNWAQTAEFALKGAAGGGALWGVPGAVAGTVGGAAVSDVITNHDYNNYQQAMQDTGRYPEIADYENDPSMNPFISDDPSMVRAVDVPTGRTS